MPQQQAFRTRSPWEDRWAQPSLGQLLDPIRDPYKKIFEQLVQEIDAIAVGQRSLIWYGDAWKWTLHYQTVDAQGNQLDTLCYIVPRQDLPLICVPLRGELIERLPLKRLGKIVREGIRSAKCAVQTHWAAWSPNNQSDVAQIMDLVRRKQKLCLTASAEPVAK